MVLLIITWLQPSLLGLTSVKEVIMDFILMHWIHFKWLVFPRMLLRIWSSQSAHTLFPTGTSRFLFVSQDPGSIIPSTAADRMNVTAVLCLPFLCRAHAARTGSGTDPNLKQTQVPPNCSFKSLKGILSRNHLQDSLIQQLGTTVSVRSLHWFLLTTVPRWG